MSNYIKKEILDLISTAIIDGSSVKLSKKVNREVYTEVDEIFKRLRGKWKGGKTQAHIFPYDPQPYFDALLKSKEMPEKNPTAFFPTPKKTALEILKRIDFCDLSMYDNLENEENNFRCLEPSAGNGIIADCIRELAPNARLDLVEFLPLNQELLKKKGYDPICGDFLEYNKDYSIKYDYIVMNPPFSVKGDAYAYITHIEHAKKMLKKSGTLAAIVPLGFLNNTTKKEIAFKENSIIHGEIYHLEKETFKESGTLINTAVIVLENKKWKYQEFNGFPSHFAWEFVLYLENDSTLIYEAEKLYNQNTFDEKKSK